MRRYLLPSYLDSSASSLCIDIEDSPSDNIATARSALLPNPHQPGCSKRLGRATSRNRGGRTDMVTRVQPLELRHRHRPPQQIRQRGSHAAAPAGSSPARGRRTRQADSESGLLIAGV